MQAGRCHLDVCIRRLKLAKASKVLRMFRMRWFRPTRQPPIPPGKPSEWPATEIRHLLSECFAPEHFFLARGKSLEWEQTAEELPWEIFKGRLLEPAHSTVTQTFAAWNAYWREQESRSTEPILSLKLDLVHSQVHVVRAIHCYVWEGYDAGGNVFLSRETTRWVRELVGSISLDDFKSTSHLRDEVVCQLLHAVVGSSRLPLTSLEAPLPAFTLGQMAYFSGTAGDGEAGFMRSPDDLIRRGLTQDLPRREQVKLLESVLRATPKERLAKSAAHFVARWKEIGNAVADLVPLFRELFEEVSLSPYTDFVDKTLLFIDCLEQQGSWTIEDRIDFLSWLLRHIGRHLTAYDLVTFHHRGANYPDALLLDAVLKSYLRLIDSRPDLFFSAREVIDQRRRMLRRRALRQGWLLRRWYAGLLVPAAPTSFGENARVLPPCYPRVPEEEILQPDKRRHRLFENDELGCQWNERAEHVLGQSISDLDHAQELQELGMALFIDRPLGASKNLGEPDQTPLLSYEAFSKSVALERVRFLAENAGLLAQDKRTAVEEKLHDLKIEGISLRSGERAARPAAVSISDALRASRDFIILRTTKKSASSFLNCFRFEILAPQLSLDHWPRSQAMLAVRETGESPDLQGLLAIYDSNRVKRLQLSIDSSQGYQCRAGLELPRAGLRLVHAWGVDGRPLDLQPMSIPIR